MLIYMAKKFDKFDIEILRILIKNSKTGISEIARQLNKSKQFVKYRIERLEREGVIQKYSVAVKWNKIGFIPFRILATGTKRIKIPKIFGLRLYNRFYNTYEFLVLSYDLRNLQYLSYYLKEEGFDIEALLRVKVVIPYNFLGSKLEPFKEKTSTLTLDKKWFWNFLTKYEQNLRKPLVHLANELEIPYFKLRKIIKDLEGSVIRGYSVIVNHEKLGYKRGVIYLSVKKNKEFLNVVNKLKNKINYMEKLIGKFDYRIEIYYKSKREFEKVINILRDFSKNIMVHI